MKRALCFLTALLLCVSLAVPAFAAEDGFVPSITYKPNPEIIPVIGEDGEEYIGVIRNSEGEIAAYIDHGCLRITPIAHVWDEEVEVPKDIEELLLFVYEKLNDGSMEIPYEKHAADLDAANMVIRDLFDVRWACEEHRAMLEENGNVLEIAFDLGVVADAQIFVMTFDEAAEEWDPIMKTVNNGDGTVTCTFEHLCVLEFSMLLTSAAAPADEAQESANTLPWIIALLLSAVGAGGVVVSKKKKTSV